MNRFFLNIVSFSLIVLSFSGLPVAGQNAPVTSLPFISNAIPAGQVSVPVTVTAFSNIGSVSLTLDYDFPSLQYVSAELNPQLLAAGGVSVNDNVISPVIHRIIIGWYTTSPGISLADNSVLITLNFNYTAGTSVLQWNDNGTSCSYTDATGTLLNDLPYSTYYFNGTVDGIPTSVNDHLYEDLVIVYQDLTGNRISIRTEGSLEGRISIKIVSLRGIIVKRIDVSNSGGTEEYHIDAAGLPPGMYLVLISSGQRRITKKILRI